jgi:hypothetical protein
MEADGNKILPSPEIKAGVGSYKEKIICEA